jgi:hypothetical protein
MNPQSVPAVGMPVLVSVPRQYASADSPIPARVADVHDRQLTLVTETSLGEAGPPAGVPCVITFACDGRQGRCEAAVIASGATMLIVDLAGDLRRHPRYRHAGTVRLEVPGTSLGVIEGVLEEISAGGLRVHTPVLLPLDARAFTSILLADTHPILAIAEVRGVQHGDVAQDLIARLQFTMMAPAHRTRLAMLLEWPVDQPPDPGGTRLRDVVVAVR